ncbi:hypothetical protein [Microbulbifer spongiae]|uniref:Uncharacterized protein n=1 Tax=Microbulbifer spongiae TaxID=2944933 RepID=A0ABY9EEQ4_9GAMM|nr:hypothetical protein [Microbulbifer sp. MI-G]WKD50523.1 hypothetical protein M8T91_03575 [Microbulbifer sp. MI-G]
MTCLFGVKRSLLGGLDFVRTWHSIDNALGERTFDQQMAEAGKKAKSEQGVRLLAIPSDIGSGAGIFDELHGFAGGVGYHVIWLRKLNHPGFLGG